MTCRDPLQRFVVEWRSVATGRWRIEHGFWTRESAQAFHDRIVAHWGSLYQWRVRERKLRPSRTAGA